METWEAVLVGIIGLAVLFIFAPGLRERMRNTRKAEPGEWTGVLVPIGLVVLLVVLMVLAVR